jgi:hypothetical protein
VAADLSSGLQRGGGYHPWRLAPVGPIFILFYFFYIFKHLPVFFAFQNFTQ